MKQLGKSILIVVLISQLALVAGTASAAPAIVVSDFNRSDFVQIEDLGRRGEILCQLSTEETGKARLRRGAVIWKSFKTLLRNLRRRKGLSPVKKALKIRNLRLKRKAANKSCGNIVQFLTPVSEVRINCGGKDYTDSQGNFWQQDIYYVDGESFADFGIDIDGTEDDFIYQSERYLSPFSYEIPLRSGRYTVRLHFSEIFWKESGKRLINVIIEGDFSIKDIDIWQTSGESNQPYIGTFEVLVEDGFLNLDFAASVDFAKVSAIEVIPNP